MNDADSTDSPDSSEIPAPLTAVPAARCARGVRFAVPALALILLVAAGATAARADAILFDASHREMAGNADWVVDADAFDLNLPAFPCTGSTNESRPQRFPTPAQAGVTGTTPETFWTGAISSWGIELVKAGHTVESLPDGGRITFGDLTNAQDLSHYALFIVVEPQAPFTSDEKTAILAFMSAGGGLFMVGDHETSDRDCDGWDSPHVWNDLTGATSGGAAGLFGIWFRVDGSDTHPSEDWFDEGVNNNVETDPVDPIVNGPFGSGAGGLGLFGSTSMDLGPANNPTVQAHLWRNGQAHGTVRATFATASYGSGRVAAIVDSSPADDGTGDSSDSLHPGWDKATGGVKNREIHLNACAWLLNPAPDTTPPVITAGPSVAPADCSAVVTWTTDEAASSLVDYGAAPSYGSSASTPGATQSHAVTLAALTPSSTVHYQVSSTDVAGNGPTLSGDATFATSASAPPVIAPPPEASVGGASSATITWTTDEPATSQVEYGLTASYGETASAPGSGVAHAVTLAGLTPSTLYHYRALSTDLCGHGPAASADGTFTTAPPSVDVSGWTIKQYGSQLTFTIPSGTVIPSGGYLVVGRDASRAAFGAFHASMPPATVYLDSNASGACANGCLPQVNGGETFELYNGASVKIDGPTIAMSSNNAYQRKRPQDPAGSGASWFTLAESSANPGQGAGAPSGAGVVINEMSDASDFTKEFVELYNDAGAAPPDATPPAAVTDLVSTPLSASSIRLSWTATGDDGTAGTAAVYDVRRSATRILGAADFAAATPLAGEPAPQAPGASESMIVSGLAADTAYWFALVVADDAANASAVSGDDGAVTAPPGGGPPPLTHLVISQVQVAGDGGTPADDELIELYNPTGAGVGLGGMSVQYKSATGTTYTAFALAATTIPSHGWYLIARSAYNGAPAADATNTAIQMAAAGGNVFLVNGTAALPSASCSASASIVDKVGYGTGNCPEGTVVAAPSANNSILRKPGGSSGSGQDTDSNAADFQAQTPAAPHNSASPSATPPPPALGSVGGTLFLIQRPAGTDLDWANAAGATGYRVYRGVTAGFMSGSPAPWATPSASRAVDPETPALVYFYLVRATDGTNETP